MKRVFLGLLVLLALGLLVFPAIAEAEKTDCSTSPAGGSSGSRPGSPERDSTPLIA